ncbi:MAG: hypothetical protein QS748_04575 [Candidatus Endonucleobacter bathymodioli]|uniref:Uncharacterized protein n=1 Tax=Candidatus Endonucleibacter bathymodioli TaxID=539814 RepID=A0AA90NKA7_9GAMM|nr:hypothetical protein [Candidatus Endonucleobacter bathymodioli]
MRSQKPNHLHKPFLSMREGNGAKDMGGVAVNLQPMRSHDTLLCNAAFT